MTLTYELAPGNFPKSPLWKLPHLYYNSPAHLLFVMNGRNRSEKSSNLSKATQLVGR